MVTTANVFLFGKEIGSLSWNERTQTAGFEYADAFIGRGIEPAPLMMPVRAGRIYSFGGLGEATFRGLPGMVADALPDTYGRALFNRWLAMTGRTSANPVESLCFLGRRCMGALEFEPAVEAGGNEAQSLEIDALVNVARAALDEKQQFATNLDADRHNAIASILRLGTSAGGQRAKAIIAYNKTTGEVRSGQVDAPAGFDYYLIKLDGVTGTTGSRDTGNYGRMEYSFFKLVRRCGIEMTDCALIEENGRAHFLTKRFDRADGRKLHMQTLCGMAHYDYRLLRGYSYEQAFNVMRALRLPYAQAQEMFRRMVFNVVARNQDDHTKNISFLMDERGTWRLSPAYDMTFAYNSGGAWTSAHQMSINGKFENITRADLLTCAARNNIKNADAIIAEVCEGVAAWPEVARECGVSREVIDAIYPQFCLEIG